MTISFSDRPVALSAEVPDRDTEHTGRLTAVETAPLRCDACGSPLADDQRYCVVCGRRSRHVTDPAVARLTARGRRPRRDLATGTVAPETGRTYSVITALAIAAVPVALVVGLSVGHSGGGEDGKLIAALRAEASRVAGSSLSAREATAGGRSVAEPAVASVPAGTTFPLARGYAVELQVLATHRGTDAAIEAAEVTARARGATQVGALRAGSYRITPAPPADATVIYAGAFAARGAAERAAAKLRRRFAQARVISVAAPSPASAATPTGKVLSSTSKGVAHQITGSRVTASQKAAGAQIVQRISHQIGSNYTAAQQGLPDQIAVP